MITAIQNFASLIRIKHWLKNGFVFLPVFFAGKIEMALTTELPFVFLSFCLAASSVYIINDIVDAEDDRLHPVKKNRPLAKRYFSKKTAVIMFIVMFTLFAASLMLLHSAYLYVIGYFILNMLYTFVLKNISIADVTSIGSGFVLRVMAGGEGSGVYVSHWMIIITFLLTVSIGFAKRRDDLATESENGQPRRQLNGYTPAFLDIAKSISFAITLISYILYSISAEVIARTGSDKLYITSLFVFLGIMRYIQITVVDKNSGSPVDVLWKDRFLQIVLLLWGLTFLIIIYGKDM